MRKLNQAEEAFTIVNAKFPFTLVCALKLNAGPSVQTLRSALDELQHIYPFLSAVVQEKNKHFYFEKDEYENPIPIQLIERTDDQQWQTIVRKELNTAFDHARGPLMRVLYLASALSEEKAEIILSFHHAIIDAVSFLPMVQKLLILAGKNDKDTNKLPSPLTVPEAHSPVLRDVLPPAFKGPRLIFKLLPFLFRQMQDELNYKKGSRGIEDAAIPISSENDLLTINFSEEETLALVKWTRSKRITLNSTITATMLKIVNRHSYAGKKELLRAVQFANLRPYLQPPVEDDGAGCFVAMMRYTAKLPPQGDIIQLAAYLDEQFKKSAKRGDKYLYAILSKMLVERTMKAHNARLGAVALSYAGAINLKNQYGDIQVNNVHAFISNNCLGAELAAFGKICFGRLSLDFNFMLAETSREKASVMVQDIHSQLLQYTVS